MRRIILLCSFTTLVAVGCGEDTTRTRDAAVDGTPNPDAPVVPDAPVLRDGPASDVPLTSDGPATDGPACAPPNVLRYMEPGCGAAAPTPVCGQASSDGCARARCSCDGKVVTLCDYSPVPFARYLGGGAWYDGASCDPSGLDGGLDAGRD